MHMKTDAFTKRAWMLAAGTLAGMISAPAAGQVVERRWGSVDAYLDQEIGLSATDIARLRVLYLE